MAASAVEEPAIPAAADVAVVWCLTSAQSLISAIHPSAPWETTDVAYKKSKIVKRRRDGSVQAGTFRVQAKPTSG
jgi:hypothetical protein